MRQSEQRLPTSYRVVLGSEIVKKSLLRDELINGEIFYTLKEAKIVIEM